MPTTANLKLPFPVESAPADVPVDIEALAEAIDAYGLTFATPGDLKLSGAIAAPAGWLLCDGRAVSRATYAALFSAIGTSYGAGDGSSTFALPDFRGRSPLGAGQGAGLTARALGAAGGEEAHTVTVGEMPSHNHAVSDPGHAHSVSDPTHAHNFYTLVLANSTGPGDAGAANASAGGGYWRWGTVTGGGGTGIGIVGAGTGVTTQAYGGGAGHNNMAPFVAVNVLIKT